MDEEYSVHTGIVMIEGPMVDPERARQMLEAANTGHKVWVSVSSSAESIAGTIARLENLAKNRSCSQKRED